MKRNIKIQSLLALVCAAVLFLPALSSAMPGGNFGPKPQCPMKPFFYSFFNITAEQQLQLEALQDATHAQIEPYRDQIQPLMTVLTDTVLADVIDTAKAQDTIAAIIALQEKILPIEMDSKVKAAQILTAEQRADMAGVKNDITDFIDYILAYPKLDALKDKYSDRVMQIMLDSGMQDLNLTAEQKTAIIALKNETEDAIEPIADNLKTLQGSFADTLLAAEIDTAAAAALIDQMTAPTSQIATIHYTTEVEGAQILTAAQRQVIRLKMAMHRGFHHPTTFPGK
jgi:Spy/CpxP family protein refolding chaperone